MQIYYTRLFFTFISIILKRKFLAIILFYWPIVMSFLQIFQMINEMTIYYVVDSTEKIFPWPITWLKFKSYNCKQEWLMRLHDFHIYWLKKIHAHVG